MAGASGEARSNDIVPNGGIFALGDLVLPGSLNLTAINAAGSLNQPSVLNVLCSGSWNANTVSQAAAGGVAHAANQEVFLPVNGVDVLYFAGSGTMQMTLHSKRSSPN